MLVVVDVTVVVTTLVITFVTVVVTKVCVIVIGTLVVIVIGIFVVIVIGTIVIDVVVDAFGASVEVVATGSFVDALANNTSATRSATAIKATSLIADCAPLGLSTFMCIKP